MPFRTSRFAPPGQLRWADIPGINALHLTSCGTNQQCSIVSKAGHDTFNQQIVTVNPDGLADHIAELLPRFENRFAALFQEDLIQSVDFLQQAPRKVKARDRVSL